MAVSARAIQKLRESGVFKIKQKIVNGRCAVHGCSNDNKSGNHPLCQKHHQQRFRACRKTESAFALLRMHARQRGLEFTISAQYFAGLTDAFCMFEHQTAESKEVLTIDRRDASKGYIPGNCTVVTRSANSIKANRERYLPEHVQAILARKRAQTVSKFEELERRMMSKAEREGDMPF